MIDTPLQPTTFERQERTEISMSGSASEFLTTLINTCVAQQEPIVLLFDDDSTLADGTLQKEVSSLIDHLPPRMHIVISTRVDSHVPLAQLSEKDRVLEVRMNASRLLNDEPHGVRTDAKEPSRKKKAQQVLQTQYASQPLLDPLSTRELEVLQLLAQGASNMEIADALVIAFATVKRHVSTILSKLQATNRTQAVAYARQLSLLH